MPIMNGYAHGQFCWVDLSAHDMKKAEEFYESLFGWKALATPSDPNMPYAQFENDAKSVAGIGQMNDEMKAAGIPQCWNSYINVEDIHAIVAAAEKLGATVTVPPMDASGAGWLAYIQDLTGANIAFWQKNTHAGAQLTNDPGSFCWNELLVGDIEKSREFYGKLCGWEFEQFPEGGGDSKYYVIKNAGQDNGGLMEKTAEFGPIPDCWTVYFSTADVDKDAQTLRSLGGNLIREPFDTPVGKIAIATDSLGGHFSLIQLANRA